MSFEVKKVIIVNESNSIRGDEIKKYVGNKEVKNDNQKVNRVNIYRAKETQVKMISEQTNNQQNNNSTIKNRKCVIVSSIIVGVILVAIVITLVCVLRSSKKPDESPRITPPETQIRTGSGEEIIVEIQRKVNQIWIYQGSDVVVTISTTSLDDPNALRRNEEQTVNTNYKFLLNIYDEKIASDNSKIFYAYALLLDKSSLIDGKEGYEGGIDIFNLNFNEENEDNEENENNENNEENEENKIESEYRETEENEDNNNNDIPLIKLKFYENGTLFEIQKPQHISHKIYSDLKNFIYKVIPTVSKDLYSNNENEKLRRLDEEGISNNYEKKDGNFYLKENREHGIKFTDIEIEDSKVEGNRIIEVDSEGNI